jgi:hypothetical protein
MQKQYQQVMEERNAQYQALRQRAQATGVSMPQSPPWADRPLSAMPGPQGQAGSAPNQPLGGAPGQMPMPPAPPEPPAMPSGPLSAQERDALREQHYQEMRERAKERGMTMPETPPWKAAGVSEEEHRAQMEKMRTMTPAQRQAHHQEMWQKMRERAKERGVDLPEAPAWSMSDTPWLSQQERERYQTLVDQLTPEQREAAKALYSGPQPPCPMGMPWGPQGQGDAPFQPPFGSGPGAQGPGVPPQGMPQGNWFGPGPSQQPMGTGGMPQPSPLGQGGPWGYGPGMTPSQGQGPAGLAGPQGGSPGFGGPQGFGPGFPNPQGYGPGFGAPQGYGPGYGGYQEMPPPPGAGRMPGAVPQ